MNPRFILPVVAVLAVFAAGVMLPPAAGADVDELSVGLRIGERIPADFLAEDETGKPREFASLKGERGLILLFTRSLDW